MARGKRTCSILYLIFFRVVLNKTAYQIPVNNSKASVRPGECKEPTCSCCLSKACDTCDYKCLEGYFGQKCLNKCPDRCVSCKDHSDAIGIFTNSAFYGFANCTECKPGYYGTTDYYQCNYKCPDECVSCLSPARCQSCSKGYFLEKSSSKYGHCVACPGSCEACTSLKKCSQCKKGFEGTICQNCTSGLYGVRCNETCFKNCKICTRSSGDCLECRQGFDGSKCGQCMRGRHGAMCNMDCPEHCKESECGRHDGHCTHGCLGNFVGDRCYKCKLGTCGPNCSEITDDGDQLLILVPAGGGVVVVVVISICLALFVLRMKRRREIERTGATHMSFNVSRGNLTQKGHLLDDESKIKDQVQELRLEIQRLRDENELLRSDSRFDGNEPLYENQ